MNSVAGRIFAAGWLLLVAGMLWFLLHLAKQTERLMDLAERTEQRLDRLESGLKSAVDASRQRLDTMEAALKPLVAKVSDQVEPLLEKIKDPAAREALRQSAQNAASEWIRRKLEAKPAPAPEDGK